MRQVSRTHGRMIDQLPIPMRDYEEDVEPVHTSRETVTHPHEGL